MIIRVALACAAFLVLPGGCATMFGPQPVSATLDRCAGWTRAEYEDRDIDVISDKLAEWLDSHDANGAKGKNPCWED